MSCWCLSMNTNFVLLRFEPNAQMMTLSDCFKAAYPKLWTFSLLPAQVKLSYMFFYYIFVSKMYQMHTRLKENYFSIEWKRKKCNIPVTVVIRCKKFLPSMFCYIIAVQLPLFSFTLQKTHTSWVVFPV